MKNLLLLSLVCASGVYGMNPEGKPLLVSKINGSRSRLPGVSDFSIDMQKAEITEEAELGCVKKSGYGKICLTAMAVSAFTSLSAAALWWVITHQDGQGQVGNLGN